MKWDSIGGVGKEGIFVWLGRPVIWTGYLAVKVISKFFLKHNKSFVLDGISGITKNIIFVRGKTLISVCFYGWVVCPLKPGL